MSRMNRRLRAPAWLLLWLGCTPGAIAEPAAWEHLSFEKRNLWATARAEVGIEAEAAGEAAALIVRIENAVSDNREEITLTHDRRTGALLERSRFSRGKEQRVKQWTYCPTGIRRLRREPPPDAAPDSAPGSWPAGPAVTVGLPPETADATVIAVGSLWALIDDLVAQPGAAAGFLVHTDFNFFRLRASIGEPASLKVNFQLDGEAVRGKRSVRWLTLEFEPLAGNPESPDVMLSGLSPPLRVAVDAATGLPLQLEGGAPRLGSASLPLVAARLRPGLSAPSP
jgi:hypothetical protein